MRKIPFPFISKSRNNWNSIQNLLLNLIFIAICILFIALHSDFLVLELLKLNVDDAFIEFFRTISLSAPSEPFELPSLYHF